MYYLIYQLLKNIYHSVDRGSLQIMEVQLIFMKWYYLYHHKMIQHLLLFNLLFIHTIMQAIYWSGNAGFFL